MFRDNKTILVMICVLILSTISGCVTLTEKNPGASESEPLQFRTIESIIQDHAIREDPVILPQEHEEQIQGMNEPTWSQVVSGIKERFINDYSTIRPFINAGLEKKQLRV